MRDARILRKTNIVGRTVNTKSGFQIQIGCFITLLFQSIKLIAYAYNSIHQTGPVKIWWLIHDTKSIVYT